MASPLTMYIQLKQDAASQAAAGFAVQNFAKGVKAGLDATEIVHYATLVLIPNMPKEPGAAPAGSAGILLITYFDLPMGPYLERFWDAGGGIKAAIQGLAAISFNPMPAVETFQDFMSVIVKANLTNTFEPNFYQAYASTVEQIVAPNEIGV